MLDVLLWISAGLWLAFALNALINRAWLKSLADQVVPDREGWPFVSIVVPARNEEVGVGAAVRSFCGQDYPNFEVIVVEDRSTDGTGGILSRLSEEFSNLQIVPGCDPPAGWLGKPNALEIGRRAALGEWLLFVDADVVYEPQMLRRAMAYCLQRDLAMLTVCPRLRTAGVMEAALMSSLYLVALACMPMFLTNVRWFKHMAAGAGATNLVRRDALEACGAFECLKDAIVDDVGLGYKIKRGGYDMHVALAGPLIRLRMYDGARAAVRGLGKNTYPALRKRWWAMPLVFVMGTVVSLLPYIGLICGLGRGFVSVPAVVSLGLMHAVLGGLAWWFRQPWYIAFLNPVRELGWWWILLRSMAVFRREGLVWRGRKYPAEGSSHE